MHCYMASQTQSLSTKPMKGYDPIKLTEKMEYIVVDGNKRKYAKLSRQLRFYGGTTSAVEVGWNLRCKFCFSDKPVFRPNQRVSFIHLRRSSKHSIRELKGMDTNSFHPQPLKGLWEENTSLSCSILLRLLIMCTYWKRMV